MRFLLAALVVLALGDTSAMAQSSSLLESLRVPAPRTVNYVNGPAPGLPGDYGGDIATDASTSTIYLGSGKPGRFDRAHEIGHLLDAQVLTDGDRRYFSRLMQAPGGDWRQGTGPGSKVGGSEWFADYYAAAATGLDLSRENVGSYAVLGPKRLRRFAAAMDRLGRRHDLESLIL